MAHHISLKLKRLQSERYVLEHEISIARNQGQMESEAIERLRLQLTSVIREIAVLENQAPEVVISEHALMRYVERILGYDMEVLTEAVLPGPTRKLIASMGSGVYPVTNAAGQQFRIRVQGTVVTTVLPPAGG